MKLSYLIASLFAIGFAFAETERNIIEEIEETDAIPSDIPEELEQDWPLVDIKCKRDLREIVCKRSGEKDIHKSNANNAICNNIECRSCIEDKTDCTKCGRHLRNTYNWQICEEIKVDLINAKDRHL